MDKFRDKNIGKGSNEMAGRPSVLVVGSTRGLGAALCENYAS